MAIPYHDSIQKGVLMSQDPSHAELDPTALAELQDLMGDDLADLIAAYIEDGQLHIDTMTAALTDGDLEALGEAAHSLKSSSANMSALQVSELARQIEALAKGGQRDQIAPLVAELPRRFAAAAEALMALNA